MAKKNPIDFFEVQEPHSKVKSEIVSKYFASWVDIMKSRGGKMTYLDLFSGRGYYKDGSNSTPLLIFDKIETKPEICNDINIFFYEKVKVLFDDLKLKVQKHPVYKKLKVEPVFNNIAISSELVKKLPNSDKTLTFIDPCGYTDLSEELLLEMVNNWGSDCIFYLSTYGIRRNIVQDNQKENFIKIFGDKEYSKLKTEIKKIKNGRDQDNLILKTLNKVLNKTENIYSCGLRIDLKDKHLSNYYLIFISKHWRGFKIMKEIMGNHEYSIYDSDEIPYFIYNNKSIGQPIETFMRGFNPRMNKIKNTILRTFSKVNNISVKNICEKLHENKFKYLDKNIKSALSELEIEGKIVIDKHYSKRMKRKGKITLGEGRLVTFI